MRADGWTKASPRTNFPGCWRNQLASLGQEGAWDPGMSPRPDPMCSCNTASLLGRCALLLCTPRLSRPGPPVSTQSCP